MIIIPKVLWLEIFIFSSDEDILKFFLVCKVWHNTFKYPKCFRRFVKLSQSKKITLRTFRRFILCENEGMLCYDWTKRGFGKFWWLHEDIQYRVKERHIQIQYFNSHIYCLNVDTQKIDVFNLSLEKKTCHTIPHWVEAFKIIDTDEIYVKKTNDVQVWKLGSDCKHIDTLKDFGYTSLRSWGRVLVMLPILKFSFILKFN